MQFDKAKIKDENSNKYSSPSPMGLEILSDMPFKIERTRVSTPGGARTHHYHDSFELYYMYSGERYYFIKDKTYQIKRGNIVLIKQYDIHCTDNLSKSGYDRILINFKKSFLDGFASLVNDVDLFRCFNKDIHIIKLDFKEQRFVETLLLSMLEEYDSNEVGRDYFLKTALIQLLILVGRYSEQRDDDAESYVNAAHKTISEVAAYINNNYGEDITLESISERFFISPYYFSRTFKRVTGIQFIEYLNGVRIKEAQRMLAKTNLSVSEVASEVGYKSVTHFGRTFKNIVGVSPLAYKKRYT